MKKIPDEMDRIQSIARCILIQAGLDATGRTHFKSHYQTQVARDNKASALRFFRSEWFATIARALNKNPDEYRKTIRK